MNAAVIFLGIAVLVFLMKVSGKFDIDFNVSTESQVERIARAIAYAEGFFTNSTLLQSRNNPVALKLDGKTITTFPTVEDGWQAAYRQIRLMLENTSSIYNREMSIVQIAPIWTGNDSPETWANAVAQKLGVDKNTPLYQV